MGVIQGVEQKPLLQLKMKAAGSFIAITLNHFQSGSGINPCNLHSPHLSKTISHTRPHASAVRTKASHHEALTFVVL